MWRNAAILLSKQLLAQSVVTRANANKLAGTTVALSLSEFSKPIYVAFHDGYLSFPESSTQKVNLTITTSLSDLAALARTDDVMAELGKRSVRIEGDTSILIALHHLLDDNDLSIAPLLIPLLGFNGAQTVQLTLLGIKETLVEMMSSQSRQSEEWLVWESELLATRPQLEFCQQQLEQLRLSVAKLQQSIQSMEK